MVFSSNIFLFLFLPLFLAIYHLTPDRYRLRNWVVLGGSYAFYAWWRIDFLVLFTVVTLWNYCVGLAMVRNGIDTPRAKRWLAAGVTLDLATLGYFKYANFGVASFDALLGAAGMQPVPWTHIILPIGISFYIFESISYIIDVSRRDTEPTRHPVDFFTFVALFPHLIAGPVFRYKDLAGQFENRKHSLALFSEGALRFMQGFIKKVFIADTIAPVVAASFSLHQPTTADAWLGALAYTLQLYFDFSGYSDMAIGLGLMMGFRFVENFNHPYVSQSITEFWRRWHMSLSSWLRDYLYIPLGGNRHGVFQTYRNLFLTMLLGGLWHGANWTYLMWGAWHGTLLCIERVVGVKPESKGFRPHRWLLTLLFVMLGWVVFRADNAHAAWRMYSAMFGFHGAGLSPELRNPVTALQVATMLVAVVVAAWGGLRDRRPSLAFATGDWRRIAATTLLLPLFLLSVLKLSAQSYSPFLYFQF